MWLWIKKGLQKERMLNCFISFWIHFQFHLKHERLKVCLSGKQKFTTLNLLSPCVAGQEQRSVMTNHLAWRVCITSKSHTLISSLLYKKLGCKFHSLHLKHLTPKLCLCWTMQSREHILINSVKGALIKAHNDTFIPLLRQCVQDEWHAFHKGFVDSGPTRNTINLTHNSTTNWLFYLQSLYHRSHVI